MLKQLFVIADVFYKELYGKENNYTEETRSNAILNFNSILVAKEDITRYENEQKESIISSLSGKEDNLRNRALLLQAMINPAGAKQWIWHDTTLVHEFYTDTSKKTGNYISSNNMIVVDLQPNNDCYEITVYTRQNDEQQTKKIAEDIWGSFTPFKTRHLYKRIPLTTTNEEIVKTMSKLLSEIKSYRDKNYPAK